MAAAVVVVAIVITVVAAVGAAGLASAVAVVVVVVAAAVVEIVVASPLSLSSSLSGPRRRFRRRGTLDCIGVSRKKRLIISCSLLGCQLQGATTPVLAICN